MSDHDHDPISTRWLLWYTAGTQHTRASTSSTDGEEEHQTEYNLARHRVCCGRSAAASCATLAKQNSCPHGDEWDETIKTCFFADLTTTDRPPQAVHAPWERELLARARAPCRTSDQPYAVPQEVPHSVWSLNTAWSTPPRAVEFKSEFCSDFPADSHMKNYQNNKITIRWHIEWRCDFFYQSKIRLPSVFNHKRKCITVGWRKRPLLCDLIPSFWFLVSICKKDGAA